jgi:hypothetical protein
MVRFVALFVVGFIALGQQPTPPPVGIKGRGEQVSKPNSQQKGADNTPPKSAISPPPPGTANPSQSPSESQTTQTKGKPEKTWRDSLNEVFAPSTWSNWALFIAAGIAALIALRTLSAIQEQARIARIGLGATRMAAVAAKKSADVAELALKSAERADVLLDSVGLIDEVDYDISTPQGYGTQVALAFANLGRTRANDAMFEARLEIPGVPITEQKLGPVVVGPGAKQAIKFNPFGTFLTQETGQGILNGTISMRFRAEVTYTDMFNESHASKHLGVFNAKTRTFFIEPEGTEPEQPTKDDDRG